MKKQPLQYLKSVVGTPGKKLMIAALISLAFASPVFAGPRTVNSRAINNLYYEFKNAKNVVWEANDDYSHATFTYDSHTMDVSFNNDGDLIGISKTISFDELPSKSKQTIEKNYADFKKHDIIEFKNSEAETSFYISMLKDEKKIILQISIDGDVSVFKPLQ